MPKMYGEMGSTYDQERISTSLVMVGAGEWRVRWLQVVSREK